MPCVGMAGGTSMTHCKGCGGESSPQNTYGHILGCGEKAQSNPHEWSHEPMACCVNENSRGRHNVWKDKDITRVLNVSLAWIVEKKNKDRLSGRNRVTGKDLAEALSLVMSGLPKPPAP